MKWSVGTGTLLQDIGIMSINNNYTVLEYEISDDVIACPRPALNRGAFEVERSESALIKAIAYTVT